MRQGRRAGAPAPRVRLCGGSEPARGGPMEVVGEVPNRTKVKRRKACDPRVSQPPVAKPSFRLAGVRTGDGLARSSAFLPGESSRPPPRRSKAVDQRPGRGRRAKGPPRLPHRARPRGEVRHAGRPLRGKASLVSRVHESSENGFGTLAEIAERFRAGVNREARGGARRPLQTNVVSWRCEATRGRRPSR